MKNNYREKLDLDLLGFVLESVEKLYMPEPLKNKVILERSKVELINAYEKMDAREETSKEINEMIENTRKKMREAAKCGKI